MFFVLSVNLLLLSFFFKMSNGFKVGKSGSKKMNNYNLYFMNNLLSYTQTIIEAKFGLVKCDDICIEKGRNAHRVQNLI